VLYIFFSVNSIENRQSLESELMHLWNSAILLNIMPYISLVFHHFPANDIDSILFSHYCEKQNTTKSFTVSQNSVCLKYIN
jgi:hypothetical protein